MATYDDNMNIHEYDQDDMEDEEEEEEHHPHNLSRLSVCTTNSSKHSIIDNDDDDDDVCGGEMMRFMSGLSIDCDAVDEELSDKGVSGVSSDSDKEISSCVSLPAGTPPRRRTSVTGGRGIVDGVISPVKEYSSDENEAPKGVESKNRRSSRRVVREKGLEKAWEEKRSKAKAIMDHEEDLMIMEHHHPSNSGRRSSLCIDLEEVKACRDLGFELEMPNRISMSSSTLDTASSGSNSPIANWRISSPGDDPKDVKARLKVWAQAVALASASRLVG